MIGITRDAYYKHEKRREERERFGARVLEEVREIRREQPRTGTKKLHAMISDTVKIGRDSLNGLLKENGMLVERRKKYARTTYSNHGYAVSPNLVKGLVVTRPEQVWVGDITYIPLKKGHAYLFLVTDKYSRKIVGYKLGDSLSHEYAIDAIERAVGGSGNKEGLIFHSDRGSQYCCHEYIRELRRHGIRSSVTDENHCYQNGLAERVNGILKDEYYLDVEFRSIEEAEKAVNQAIDVYNNKRLHRSLNLEVPAKVHAMAA